MPKSRLFLKKSVTNANLVKVFLEAEEKALKILRFFGNDTVYFYEHFCVAVIIESLLVFSDCMCVIFFWMTLKDLFRK